jgi:hypothetical protein
VLLKSAELVGWALGGLEREITQTRERLAALTQQADKLRARAGGTLRSITATSRANDSGGARRRGRMTADGRKRISEMMKKRWAEAKKKNRNHL